MSIKKYVLYWKVPDDIGRTVRKLAFINGGKPTTIEPHCSIFHGYMDSSDEHFLLDAIAVDYGALSRPLMKFRAVEVFTPNILAYVVKKSPEIQHIHDTILERVSDIGFYPQDHVTFDNSDRQLHETYIRYGMPYFGGAYNPHVSIYKKDPPSGREDVSLLLNKEFYPDNVTLIRKDDKTKLFEFKY